MPSHPSLLRNLALAARRGAPAMLVVAALILGWPSVDRASAPTIGRTSAFVFSTEVAVGSVVLLVRIGER
ncbi:MAG: hypothetical protein K2W81_08100 [Sphingomonas sp.]|uniref:hypothetical protein n=1 Tax=Sphingomonas sp. TaxID=28214 RepID=UPI0025FBD1B3|nr:hypothetical protein [Sphingomonas sp.]MBY0283911.1 hypothetical protein [Sphingomonas sp.]